MRILSSVVEPPAGDVPSLNAKISQSRAIRWQGVVTLGEISLISVIEQRAKSLKPHASAFAVIGQFCSTWLNVTTPVEGLSKQLHEPAQLR
jgi:hypothetical protein